MRTWSALLVATALWGCGSPAPGDSSQPKVIQAVNRAPPVGARGPGVAVRIPAKGGVPRMYRLPVLTEIPGATRGKLPPVRWVVGLDAESELLYTLSAKGEALALDLESGRLDTVAVGVEQATLGPDGTLYTVDTKRHVLSMARRARLPWPQPLPSAPHALFGAADQHLVAVLAQDPPRLATAAADQPPAIRPLPVSGDVAATRWGDLLAVASDSGVLLVDPLGRRDAAFVPLEDHPRAVVFSPSGHRIYVARRASLGLAAIDRYDRKEMDGIALPTPAAAIRIDPVGRWLLARPTTGDSVWVVDLPVRSLVGSVATTWGSDLPAISPDGSLLVRAGGDVVAYRPDSLKETGRAPGGGTDLWVLTSWRPRGAYRPTAVAEAQAATPEGGDAAGEAGGPLYVQVSTSQNEGWSSEMAQQLSRAGLAAHVLQPKNPDEGYRVVLGPYPTRAQAEAIGKKLGRPFWIYQPPP